VWVLGENARRELEGGENGLAAGRVEIWKDGGRQVLSIDPRTHTYYDAVAFWAKNGAPRVAPETLAVRSPFKPQGVEGTQVRGAGDCAAVAAAALTRYQIFTRLSGASHILSPSFTSNVV